MAKRINKVEEAQAILKALGLPEAQRARLAAYTLLALADIGKGGDWAKAQRRSIRIHDILQYLKTEHKRIYAENTRETVRRQVLHQFEQARVVDRNPDDPTLPTNSPRTHYALSIDALAVIRAFGTKGFHSLAAKFTAKHGALLEVYRASRSLTLVPIVLPDGRTVELSPGKHNVLQREVIEQFAPRFAPKATLLYLGDTADKLLYFEKDILAKHGVPATQHDKLPDVVLLDSSGRRLFLVEAVTSHGPVSPKRKREIDQLLKNCSLALVYVSAFPDFAEFKSHLSNIAWETEVWIAEAPDHMIHFNGDRFLTSLS
jgi:hypothetical protein